MVRASTVKMVVVAMVAATMTVVAKATDGIASEVTPSDKRVVDEMELAVVVYYSRSSKILNRFGWSHRKTMHRNLVQY